MPGQRPRHPVIPSVFLALRARLEAFWTVALEAFRREIDRTKEE